MLIFIEDFVPFYPFDIPNSIINSCIGKEKCKKLLLAIKPMLLWICDKITLSD